LAFGIVRGLVIVGVAYLAFTHFVPQREQPRWVTHASLLPLVQSTANVLLGVVPNPVSHYAAVPGHDGARPAPMQKAANPPAAAHDPMADLIRQNGNPGAAHGRKADGMAELIRRSEGTDSHSKSTLAPVQHKSGPQAAKSYGAGDRQALDRLIETGGSDNR
jgi:hypothetical protein